MYKVVLCSDFFLLLTSTHSPHYVGWVVLLSAMVIVVALFFSLMLREFAPHHALFSIFK